MYLVEAFVVRFTFSFPDADSLDKISKRGP